MPQQYNPANIRSKCVQNTNLLRVETVKLFDGDVLRSLRKIMWTSTMDRFEMK